MAHADFMRTSLPRSAPSGQGNDTLHGGRVGFDKVRWTVEEAGPTYVRFSYRSWDGEEVGGPTLSASRRGPGRLQLPRAGTRCAPLQPGSRR